MYYVNTPDGRFPVNITAISSGKYDCESLDGTIKLQGCSVLPVDETGKAVSLAAACPIPNDEMATLKARLDSLINVLEKIPAYAEAAKAGKG